MFNDGSPNAGCAAVRMPTVRERCLRVILAGAVAGAVALPAVAVPQRAYAENGSVTISSVANEGATYNVYQVFAADIDENNNATHVSWASDSVKAAVLAFLDGSAGPWASTTQPKYSDWLVTKGYTAADAHDNAQNAAEYIAERIDASEIDTGAATDPSTRLGWSFANMLARSLASAGFSSQTATAGSSFTGPEGYYLFVTAGSSIGADEFGSAPMWVPLGGSSTAITAKEAAASVTFQVKDDRSGASWGKAADSNIGQDIEYQIVGTVPRNIKAYPSFHDVYTVQLPAGMTLASGNTSSVVVKVGSTDVTSSLTGAAGSVSYANGKLTVDIADLTTILAAPAQGSGSVRDTALTSATTVTITYRAHAVEGAVAGEAGNESSLVRAYTADPVSLSSQTASTQTVKNYVYQAKLVKIDKSNKQQLADAKFTIQVASGNTDAASVGKYVQVDGSLGDAPYEFTTGSDGSFTAPGLDEGVYTVAETAAPEGYEVQDSDIVLTVSSELDASTGGLSRLYGNVTGGEAASVAGDEATKFVSATASTGVVELQAADDRSFEMPVTGLAGNAALYAVAGVLGVTGAAGLAVSRRKNDDGGK